MPNLFNKNNNTLPTEFWYQWKRMVDEFYYLSSNELLNHGEFRFGLQYIPVSEFGSFKVVNEKKYAEFLLRYS